MYKPSETKIENTVFETREKGGKVISYRISPKEGYKLHEITLDEPILDEETGEETGEVKKGYTTAFVTAGANYDFETNERQIYSIPDEGEGQK